MNEIYPLFTSPLISIFHESVSTHVSEENRYVGRRVMLQNLKGILNGLTTAYLATICEVLSPRTHALDHDNVVCFPDAFRIGQQGFQLKLSDNLLRFAI